MNNILRSILILALTTFSLAVHAQSNNNKGATPVEVENGPNNPIPVTITDAAPNVERVRIVLGETKNCAEVPCNNTFGTSFYAVPEGKTLLIDEVAVSESFTGLGGTVFLSTTGLGEQIQVPVLDKLTVSANRSFASRSVRMHTTGRVLVEVAFDQAPTALVAIRVVLFGRLVDGSDTFIDCDPDSCW